MARIEQDREDILREATALLERVELRLPTEPELVVAGFRRDGGLSLYFGADPVVHLLATGELRRGYDGGRLLKAVAGELVVMHRVRTDHETILRSRALTPEETLAFRHRLISRLCSLRDSLVTGVAETTRQVPESVPVANRLRKWLESWNGQLPIADRPNVGESRRDSPTGKEPPLHPRA